VSTVKNLPEGYTSRPARMQDADQATSLFNACSMEQLGEAPHDAEEQRVEWRTPKFDLERDTRAILGPDEELVGYAEVWNLEEPYVSAYGWGRVHPDHRGRGIGSALLVWEEERARQALELAPEDARVTLNSGALVKDQLSRRCSRSTASSRSASSNGESSR